MKHKIAFFDVDHTLTYHSTGLWMAIGAVRAGLVPIFALLTIPFVFLWYRFGPSVATGGKGQIFPKGIPVLKGIRRERLEEVANRCFSRHIDEDLYTDARSLITAMRQAGTQVVLATTSLDIIIEPVARSLGAHAVIANRLAFEDERCTGRFEGDLIFGRTKYDACLAFARERGVNLSDCAFYSDSIHDLPLLLSVGKPCAVNPDWRLRAYAKKAGWEILDFAKQ